MTVDMFPCGDCGQHVTASEFHPPLYCWMYKTMKVSNQEHYLRECGFVRDMSVTGLRPTTAVAHP